jgi:hypothetical protein
MTLEKRIQSFELLGNILRRYHENSSEPEMLPLIAAAQISYAENPWFTPRNIQTSLNSLGEALKIENLRAWLSTYQQKTGRPLVQKVVGVIMAGNIPAVGFHDFLCVLLSGHKIKARLSSADARLLPAMAEILLKYEPEWDSQITFITGKLEHFDAIIATGSNNSSRYFEYYFGKYPNIIRKNRNSVAVITGDENGDELEKLADDMMLYFGLGCRSISKLYVPEGYDFSPLIKALQKYDQYVNHNKYRNNYDYCRTMLLMNLVPYIDAGCLLLKEDHSITSRIAVLHYEFYLDPDRVLNSITENRDTIQCVVCHRTLRIATVHPGKAQYPALWEYADEVDTQDILRS